MTTAAALALATVFSAGVGVGVQAAILGAVRRRRGVVGSTRLSFTGTFVGAAAVLAPQAVAGERLLLVGSALGAAVMLALLIRGLPVAYAGVGFLGLLYLGAGANGVNHLGVGVTVAAGVAGQMFSSLALDARGALGMAHRGITRNRVVGAVLIVVAVALIRLG